MMNLQDYVKSQESASRIRNFEELTSKKKLGETGYFTDEQMKLFNELKNTFAWSVHSGHRYLIATIYGKDKKYTFLVIDSEKMEMDIVDSIKNAKKRVLELVGISEDLAEEQLEEEEKENSAEQPAPQAESTVGDVADAPKTEEVVAPEEESTNPKVSDDDPATDAHAGLFSSASKHSKK